MATGYASISNGAAYGDEYGRRAKRKLHTCPGCGCQIPPIKSRCSPCAAERLQKQNTENARRRRLAREAK